MPAYYKKTIPTTTSTGNPAVLTNGETAPVAQFSSSYSILTATFNATASTTGASGGIIKYAWDFGDNTYKNGSTITKVFSQPGTYTVKLTVTDSAYRTATVTNTITILATVADFFNRANSTTLGTAADGSSSKAWTSIPASNTVGIVSNQAKATSGTATVVSYVDTGSTGGTVQAMVSTLLQGPARSAFIAFRVTDISNFWFAQLFWAVSNGGQGIRIIKKVSGTNTILWSNDYTLSVNDVIKITDDGTNVKLYVNGIVQTPSAIADTALNTATKVGTGGSYNSDPTTGFDNFFYWNSIV